MNKKKKNTEITNDDHNPTYSNKSNFYDRALIQCRRQLKNRYFLN